MNPSWAGKFLTHAANPTVEACVTLRDGTQACASVPSGASTGMYEACELRDGGEAYGGKGVQQAVDNINAHICGALNDMLVTNQQAIDTAMCAIDGTENKSRLGRMPSLQFPLLAQKQRQDFAGCHFTVTWAALMQLRSRCRC